MEARAVRLTIRSGPQAGSFFELPDEGIVRVGSSSACQLALQAEGVLEVHCFVKCAGGRLLLAVREKEAVVLVNGEEARKRFLEPGDVLEIGGVSLAVEVSREDPLVGTTLGGYRIQKLLGRGAMGHVYQATQLSLERQVALKVLSPELTKNASFVQEFLKEARAAAKLNHPNVVQVFDAAQDGETFFFSMEFLPGGTLGDLLEEKGRLGLDGALRVACDTARALAWAEEKGIVHRDIKPDNLLFTADGTVKVADLGIAADLLSATGAGEKRSVGIGSPRYMAPEQALGKAVDHRADIYALGSTLYRMIAGRAPFEGKTPAEIVRAKTTEDPVPLSKIVRGVPAKLSALVQTLLARDPEERPPSCRDVLVELDKCIAIVEGRADRGDGAAGPGAREAPPGGDRTASWWLSTSGKITLAASGLFVLLALLFALTWHPSGPSGDGGTKGSGGAQVTQVIPPSPEDDSAKEGELPGDQEKGAPPPVAPDLSSNPAEIAALKELGDIISDWRANLLDPRRALAALEDFKRKHPEPQSAERADRFITQIRESLNETGRSALAKTVGELGPLLEASEFNQATKKLLALSERFPDNREEINAEIQKVDEAAQASWKSVQENVAKCLEAGDHAGAADALKGLERKYPAGLQGAIEEKAAEVAKAETEYLEAYRTLASTAAKVQAALSALDFDGAQSLAAGIPDFKVLTLSKQKESLSSEVRLSKDAWEKLHAGASSLAGGSRPVGLAFEPSPALSEGSYRIKAIEGGLLTVQKEGVSSPEKRPVLSLVTKNLLELVGQGGEPSTELLEGLGLLLLRFQGPERARQLLTDDRLGAEKKESYRARLEEETAAFLSGLVARETARMVKLSSALSAKGGVVTPDLVSASEALSEDLLRTISLYRATPAYSAVRADLARLFIQARAAALLASAPQCLFHGKVKSYKPDGTVELVYAFLSDEDLEDFVPVQSSKSRVEREGKMAKFRGELRLGHGDVFKSKLTVSGRVPGSGYSLQAPNINVALWTRDDDAISPVSSRSGTANSKDATPNSSRVVDAAAGDFLVFGIGYKHNLYNSRASEYGYLTLRGANTVIPMPANVLLCGTRGAPLHSSAAEDECLWGVGVISKIKGPQVFRVSMSPESLLWTVNGRAMPLRESKSLGVIKRSGYLGSVTIFTNGEVVYLDGLTVEGELNPAWLTLALERLAEVELKKAEPDFPFKDAAAEKAGSKKSSSKKASDKAAKATEK